VNIVTRYCIQTFTRHLTQTFEC